MFDPRRIQVVSFGNPRAFIYKSFLSTAECDFLIVSWSHSSVDIKNIFLTTGRNNQEVHLVTSACTLRTGIREKHAQIGVVDADGGNSLYSEIRTSLGSFIPSGECGHASSVYLISPLDRALDMMLKISCFRNESNGATDRKSHSHLESIQPSHGEPIQVLRYQARQEYKSTL